MTGVKNNTKRVQWKESCRCRPVPYVDDQDIHNVWYNTKDYRTFKRERKAAATLAKNVGSDAVEDTDFTSCRGIEFLIDTSVLKSKINRQRNACVAVLVAQMEVIQESAGRDDDVFEPNIIESESISLAYSKYTQEAQVEASQRGIQWSLSTSNPEEQDSDRSSLTDEDVDPCKEDDDADNNVSMNKNKSTSLFSRSSSRSSSSKRSHHHKSRKLTMNRQHPQQKIVTALVA